MKILRACSLLFIFSWAIAGCGEAGTTGAKDSTAAEEETFLPSRTGAGELITATTDHGTDKPTTSCKETVLKILESADAYRTTTSGLEKAVKANGGTGFSLILAGSPRGAADSAMSTSPEYIYDVHESYADRAPRVMGFKFDPASKKLYQEDVVNATWLEVKFDEALLSQFNQRCK